MTVLQTIAVAFAMFSAVPVPQFDWNEKNMRYSLCAFPLVGNVCGDECRDVLQTFFREVREKNAENTNRSADIVEDFTEF